MNRETPYTPVYKRALFALLSTCLVLGMLPTYAFGSGETPATAERPAIVSEEVAVGQGSAPLDAMGSVDGEPQSSSKKGEIGSSEAENEAKLSESASGQTPRVLGQVSADVSLSGNAESNKTLLNDGLEFAVHTESKTAALVGWYGAAPKGDLVIPSYIADGEARYEVVSIGETADVSERVDNSTINEPSNKPSDASRNSAGGGPYLMPQNFSL